MINRSGAVFEINCDGCTNNLDVDSDGDWSEMIMQLKERGWKIEKNTGGEYYHYCPTCRMTGRHNDIPQES